MVCLNLLDQHLTRSVSNSAKLFDIFFFFVLHYSLEAEIPTVTTTASVVFILPYVPHCLQTLASPEHLLETLQIRQPPSIRQMPLRPQTA